MKAAEFAMVLEASGNLDLTNRIVAGAEYLDAHDPDLIVNLDETNLEMNDCNRCVLGQAVGDYGGCTYFTGTDDLYDGSIEDVVKNFPVETQQAYEKAKDLGILMTYEEAMDRGFHLKEDELYATWEDLSRGWAALIAFRKALKKAKETVQ